MIGEIEKLLDRDKLFNKEIIEVITSDTQIKAFNQMMLIYICVQCLNIQSK
jgi:hypothetical protein